MDFKPDDKIRHAKQPGWGVGVVLTAQRISHEGKPCQRLTVRFDQAGKKTVSTAFADLRRLEAAGTDGTPPGTKKPAAGRSASQQPAAKPAPRPATRPAPIEPPAPVATAEQPSPEVLAARIVAIPDDLADPFRPIADRLHATAEAYRFDPATRDLLDWATIQTGLHDPLSVFSRHDLEQHYQTYRIHLDRHLKALLDECRTSRLDPRPMLAKAHPAVQQALRRINPGR